MDEDRWDWHETHSRVPSWYGQNEAPAPPTWTARFERLLMQLAILGLMALVLVQTLLTVPLVRQAVVTLERLEGVVPGGPATVSAPTAQGSQAPPDSMPRSGTPGTSMAETSVPVSSVPAAVSLDEGHIAFMLVSRSSAPEAALLVNGRVVATFAQGRAEAQVAVGERIAVDGSGTSDPLTFRVVAAEGWVANTLGLEFTTRGDRRVLAPKGAVETGYHDR